MQSGAKSLLVRFCSWPVQHVPALLLQRYSTSGVLRAASVEVLEFSKRDHVRPAPSPQPPCSPQAHHLPIARPSPLRATTASAAEHNAELLSHAHSKQPQPLIVNHPPGLSAMGLQPTHPWQPCWEAPSSPPAETSELAVGRSPPWAGQNGAPQPLCSKGGRADKRQAKAAQRELWELAGAAGPTTCGGIWPDR